MKWRKNYLITVFIVSIALGTSSCNRGTCPTFDDTARIGSTIPSKTKTKSGVVPKDFDSSKKKSTKKDKKKPTTKKKKWK